MLAVGWCALWPGVSHAGWTPLAHTAPNGVGLMLLLPDGSVMAASRQTDPNEVPLSSGSKIWYRLTPDNQGSYVNGTWTTLTSSAGTRLWYSSQILNDGRVFVAGGEYGTGGSSAEIYDPRTNAWTTPPAPGVFLSDSISKVLPNGTVLVAPASGSVTTIYDPIGNSWSNGPMPINPANQNEVTWLRLPDDSILTVPTNSLTSQRFIPSTNSWVADANVGVNLYSSVGSEVGGAFLLDNGEALYIGGDNTTAIYTPSYNASPGSWRAGPTIPNVKNASGTLVPAGAPDAGACMMVNGQILCTFSPQMFPNPLFPGMNQPQNIFPTPTSFAIYDRGTNTFTKIDGPTGETVNVPSFQNLMLALPSGEVLYTNWGTQLYVYSPAGPPAPLASGKPTIQAIKPNTNSSFHLSGTKLSGISEGASYGDDAQMETNFPIIRLTDINGYKYYATTHHWSSRGVQTGNAVVTTEFDLPTSVLFGGPINYSLVVVANGIASDPVNFTGPTWVDFNFVSFPLFTEDGSFVTPYNTLPEGVSAAPIGGLVNFKAGSSNWNGTVNKPLTFHAFGGPVTIGQ